MLHIQDSPYIKTIHYENADDFLKAISYKGELYNLFDKQYIYRGHSTDEYELIPTALRGNLVQDTVNSNKLNSADERYLFDSLAQTEFAQILQEYNLLQDFYRVCDTCGLYIPHVESLRNSLFPGVDAETLFCKSKWIPKKYWELAALAQHYGVKTRLLDWTHDIYVALYFATKGVYYDSKEKNHLLKAFAAFREGDNYSPKHNLEIWALRTNLVIYNPKIPLHIIQPRYHDNDNLCAQKGMLTFWESDYPGVLDKEGKPNFKACVKQITNRKSLDVLLDSYLRENKATEVPILYQITIPQDTAYEIYSFVERIGYNASTMFPGYVGVAKFLKEHSEIHSKEKNKKYRESKKTETGI